MARPTDEELKAELKETVDKHNQALEIVNKCKTKFIELQAIIKDREAASKDTTST